MSREDVVIVGAGLAGLACARQLRASGLDPLVLEASDGVGGRVRTDEVDGFRLDRGFQVLLTAYPEAQRVLDYGALRLRPFRPGAVVMKAGQQVRLSDPWREPGSAFRSLFAPVGTLPDRLRLAQFRARTLGGSVEELLQRPETTTLDALRQAGFSEEMVEQFFRPFFGGIFLEPGLETSSRMLEFVFRMMAEGDTSVPEAGMGAIPAQLARDLPADRLRLRSRAASVAPGRVVLDDGVTVDARAVVVATDGWEAARLCAVKAPRPQPVACLYFSAPEPPLDEALLVLNGDGRGPVNNLCVPSAVSPGLAPAGQALVSATVLDGASGDDTLVPAVRAQLEGWFGSQVAGWKHLRTYLIPRALPGQPRGEGPQPRPTKLEAGLHVCGDYRESASIQGALVSGRRAAEGVAADLRQ